MNDRVNVRKAVPSEFVEIYEMGFDVWSGGKTLDAYLISCAESPKYKRGIWYVLEDEAGQLCASLITYELSPQVFGIGSVSTHPTLRLQGFASSLTSMTVRILEAEGAALTYLWSDIGLLFYERFDFVALSTEDQADPRSVCMVRRSNLHLHTNIFEIVVPKYF